MWPTTEHLYTIAIYPSEDKQGTRLTKDIASLTVQDNQTKDEDYRISDFMYYYDCWDRAIDDIVNIPFEHRLSKITIVVKPNEVVSESELSSKVTYVSVRAKKTTQLNSLYPNGVSGNDTWIDAFSSGSTTATYNPSGVSCIIPPQTISEGEKFILIRLGGDGDFYYTAPEGGLKFESGKEYKFTVSLKDKNLVLGAPSISNWLDGGTKDVDAQ